MDWFNRKVYGPLWVNGGILGKVVFAFLAVAVIIALSFLVATVLGFARAAQPDPFDPSTWFTSTDAVISVVGILLGFLVKVFTALGKDWLQTSGTRTVVLSGVLAVVIAGIGGYEMLGAFHDLGGGIRGALQAAWLTLLAFLTANGSAKADRQAVAGAVQRVENAEAHAKARLQ